MDVRMPGTTTASNDPEATGGLEATRRLTGGASAAAAGPRVLVLTTFDQDDYLFAAIRAGAGGFLLKRAAPEELIAAVRAVAAGDGTLSPTATARLINEFARAAPPSPSDEVRQRLDRLTDREREVLLLLARGCSNAEISRRLYVGEATTKTHVRRVLGKLEVRDRIHAVIFAFDHGLVRPGSSSECS
jgi:DNA-binding NarL/FixJ family response regulator